MVDIFRFFSIFLCTRSVRSYFLVLDSMCVLDVQMGCNGVVVGLSSSIDAGVLGGVGGGAWELGVLVKRGPDAFVLLICDGFVEVLEMVVVEHKASIFLF